jgi:hypothetical protein
MTTETRARKITSETIAWFVTSAPQVGPTNVEVTSSTETPYASASESRTCAVWSFDSSDVCTRSESEPTTATRGGSPPASTTASSASDCSSVCAPETVNCDPPRKSMPGLMPLTNRTTKDATMRTAPMANHNLRRPTTSNERLPV